LCDFFLSTDDGSVHPGLNSSLQGRPAMVTEVADDGSTGAACPDRGHHVLHVLHSLPLLVFEHQPAQNETPRADDDDGDDAVREMSMFSISGEREYTEAIPAMLSTEDKMCSATPQGWIFITQDAPPWEAWLWHPLTGETIPLPPIQDDHYIPVNSTCVLTHSSAAHPDCAVIVLDICDPNLWFCWINGGSSRAWGQHTYDVGEYILPGKDDNSTPTKRIIAAGIAAVLGGKLHFIFSESDDSADKMGVVHLNFSNDPPTAELHTLEGIANIFPEGMCSGVPWLLESQGELFHVCVGFREFDPDKIGDVLIHKMDFDGDRRWHRVHDIGDRVFMLPHEGNAVSCSASACNLQGNRVYFMKNFLEDDGNLCIYDLKDQVIKILAVHERDLTLARTKPYWIVPPA
jgi:hypothetical protein